MVGIPKALTKLEYDREYLCVPMMPPHHYHISVKSFYVQAPQLIVPDIEKAIMKFNERVQLIRDLTGSPIKERNSYSTIFESGDEVKGWECFGRSCNMTEDPPAEEEFLKEDE